MTEQIENNLPPAESNLPANTEINIAGKMTDILKQILKAQANLVQYLAHLDNRVKAIEAKALEAKSNEPNKSDTH